MAGIALPETHGGAGLGMVEFAIIAEAAGAQVAAIPLLGLATAARAIGAGGSDAQRAEWLPKLISGDKIAAALVRDSIANPASSPHGAVADLVLLAIGERAWLGKPDDPGSHHYAIDDDGPDPPTCTY